MNSYNFMKWLKMLIIWYFIFIFYFEIVYSKACFIIIMLISYISFLLNYCSIQITVFFLGFLLFNVLLQYLW